MQDLHQLVNLGLAQGAGRFVQENELRIVDQGLGQAASQPVASTLRQFTEVWDLDTLSRRSRGSASWRARG